jgi:hypothetical protein
VLVWHVLGQDLPSSNANGNGAVFMKRRNPPQLKGNVEVSLKRYGRDPYDVFIGGDREGLRALAKMLLWLADANQEATGMPDGEREHLHLSPGLHLSASSRRTELCRLDARSTGEFPCDFVAKAART